MTFTTREGGQSPSIRQIVVNVTTIVKYLDVQRESLCSATRTWNWSENFLDDEMRYFHFFPIPPRSRECLKYYKWERIEIRDCIWRPGTLTASCASTYCQRYFILLSNPLSKVALEVKPDFFAQFEVIIFQVENGFFSRFLFRFQGMSFLLEPRLQVFQLLRNSTWSAKCNLTTFLWNQRWTTVNGHSREFRLGNEPKLSAFL